MRNSNLLKSDSGIAVSHTIVRENGEYKVQVRTCPTYPIDSQWSTDESASYYTECAEDAEFTLQAMTDRLVGFGYRVILRYRFKYIQ